MINIITLEPPTIGARWSQGFRDFVSKCLSTDPDVRPSADELLKHPWLANSSQCKSDYASCVNTWVTERDAAKAKKKAAEKE